MSDESSTGVPGGEDDGRNPAGELDATARGESTPLLVGRDLAYAFGDVPVLRGASIELEAGRVTALVGPNGSGKTTLFRLLVGLLEPDAGSVSRAGSLERAARPIGYLPQRPAFRPGFTARETLAFYVDLVGGAGGDPDELLERVGLAGAADRRVGALSGGMGRLLGVAQALVGDPPAVVLDEPASGLDPGMCARVYGTAGTIADAGRGVLVSSHDLQLAERHADLVAVLAGGRIVASGPPSALLERHGASSLAGVYEAVVTGESGTVSVRAGDGP